MRAAALALLFLLAACDNSAAPPDSGTGEMTVAPTRAEERFPRGRQ